MPKFTTEEKWTVLHMLSFLTMFFRDCISNEERWENLMDAILLILIPSPWERSKAIFNTESEAERGTKSGARPGSRQENT